MIFLSNLVSRFLWAKLQLDEICRQGNEEQVRSQLERLPDSLGGTYDRIWTRITSEISKTERKWALKTLSWVLRAKSPLSPQEILEATAFRPSDVSFDQNRMASSIDYLIQACSNFIAMDVQTNRLRFIHYSVQEYLHQKPEFNAAESILAEVCLTVLASRAWEDRTVSCHSLYSYAVRHWEKHCRYWEVIDDRRGNLLQQFLLSNRCVMAWWEARVPSDTAQQRTSYDVASYSNLPVVLRYLRTLGAGDDGFDLAQSKSLIIAASRGHLPIVNILLDASIDINAQDKELGSPLQAAARCGAGEIVELLLNAGANIDAKGGTYGVALNAAAFQGLETVVAQLLNAGANANAECLPFGFPLQSVACQGYEAIADLLLKAGADVNANNWIYGSALQAAACHGFDAMVDLLLKAGADVNAKGGAYGFALQGAACQGFERVVGMLLLAGADINGVDWLHGTPMAGAAFNGRDNIVKLLLDAGADINASIRNSGPAWEVAFKSGRSEVLALLEARRS